MSIAPESITYFIRPEAEEVLERIAEYPGMVMPGKSYENLGRKAHRAARELFEKELVAYVYPEDYPFVTVYSFDRADNRPASHDTDVEPLPVKVLVLGEIYLDYLKRRRSEIAVLQEKEQIREKQRKRDAAIGLVCDIAVLLISVILAPLFQALFARLFQ